MQAMGFPGSNFFVGHKQAEWVERGNQVPRSWSAHAPALNPNGGKDTGVRLKGISDRNILKELALLGVVNTI